MAGEQKLNPRMIGIGGPVEGGIFALAEEELTIGRDHANVLPIEDWSVSRRHCAIRKLAEDQFEIRDLGSRNGTAVNGLPVTQRVLGHGDEIRIGQCHFVFLLSESNESAGPVTVQFDDEALDTQTFHNLRPENNRLKLDAPQEETAASSRVSDSLAVLVRLGAGLHTARGTEEIARLSLERIFEAIPAERGAILLYDGARDEPVFACSRDRDGGLNAAVHAYSEIVARVRREGIAILAGAPVPGGSVPGGSVPGGSVPGRSVPGGSVPGGSVPGRSVAGRSRRVLAAPVISQGATIGVIHLEAKNPGVAFDDEHQQLAAAIGGILGLPFENARRLEWLEAENRRLQEAIDIQHDMIGAGPRMREVFQLVAKAAPTGSTILIRGESGTGKELVARAIHRNSPRSGQPFIAINCAALTETLLESELFGHEKGAFTGAFAQKKGKLEMADRGTLFLDEAGELPLAFQTKLLRVLQEREFERVGGIRPIRVDVRLIAATNRNLESAIASNTFRQDLYYRLNVVSLTMPPLRERREDIPLLARHFTAKHGKRAERRVAGLSPEAIACLEAYDWPGNVRELENAVERAVVLGSTELIIPEDLPEAVLEAAPSARVAGEYHQTVREEKKRAILSALERSEGNYTEAAKLLGVHPNYLHRLIRNLDLKAEARKAAGESFSS